MSWADENGCQQLCLPVLLSYTVTLFKETGTDSAVTIFMHSFNSLLYNFIFLFCANLIIFDVSCKSQMN